MTGLLNCITYNLIGRDPSWLLRGGLRQKQISQPIGCSGDMLACRQYNMHKDVDVLPSIHTVERSACATLYWAIVQQHSCLSGWRFGCCLLSACNVWRPHVAQWFMLFAHSNLYDSSRWCFLSDWRPHVFMKHLVLFLIVSFVMLGNTWILDLPSLLWGRQCETTNKPLNIHDCIVLTLYMRGCTTNCRYIRQTIQHAHQQFHTCKLCCWRMTTFFSIQNLTPGRPKVHVQTHH